MWNTIKSWPTEAKIIVGIIALITLVVLFSESVSAEFIYKVFLK